MIVATLLKYAGVAMFAAGALVSMSALFYIAPGRPRAHAFMRGSFQTEKDYTRTGWRLFVWGRRVAFAGFAIIFVSIFAFGAG